MANLKDLDISDAELIHIRGIVSEFKKDGFSTDEAIKKAIKQMLKESQEELTSIEKQIKEQA